jgi:outer membrane protein assembly factor BamB
MDRRRLATGIGFAVALAGLVVAGVVIIPRSDAATTHLTTAAKAPPALPPSGVPATATVRWSARSLPPGGSPADTGSVIVASGGTITGRDPKTGAELWKYERTNATVCGWVVQDGAVIAAYGKPHGCTDLIALNAGTGARRWYRNADLGTDATLVSTNGVVVLRSGDTLLAVDTSTGLNRWTAKRPNCMYGPVQLSALGALVLLHCPEQTLLVDHDAYADTEHWAARLTGENPAVLWVGDPTALLSTVDGSPTITTYDGQGKVRGTVTDPRLAVAGGVPPAAVGSASYVVLWTGDGVVGVNTATRKVAWTAPALAAPRLDGQFVLVTDGGGFTERAIVSGTVVGTTRLTGGGPGRFAVPGRIGALVTANSPDTLTIYG